MSSVALRPGVALGPYPERREPEPRGIERTAARLAGRWTARQRTRPARFQERVRRTGELAGDLEKQGEAELARSLPELRRRLRAEGLTDELLVRCFALVREIAGRRLGMRHYDAQLFGGFVMADGLLAEMETGEGKTLTATLPACAAALAGIPVHVITVNDYLAARDAELMLPVYRALGLKVGAVTETVEDPAARRAAYACDVTYTTNKQLAFDYLRDRIVRGRGHGTLPLQLERLHAGEARIDALLLRGLCFAIVDEADSVLVDEARTPLILSRVAETKGEEKIYREALRLAERLSSGRDFVLDERERQVRITDHGRGQLTKHAASLHGVWTGPRRREELVQQALTAVHLHLRDRHYLVRDDTIQIIDPHTGRVMADRAWERGLHQLVETKEGCTVTGQRETLARISYQQFFRRYLRLAGMTGTAQEVRGELTDVYRLPMVRVPTHRPVQRIVLPDRIYRRAEERWSAVVERIAAVHRLGRPVLVGTGSVAASEDLSRRLDEAGLPHEVLNARQDHREAEIVAQAGEQGRITVATHMAGRGTDIQLGPGVADRGGLYVIATERAEARRIDRQLRGRCARQGDPGSCEGIYSLEDDLPHRHLPRVFFTAAQRIPGSRGFFSGWLGSALMWIPQRAVERQHGRMRRELLAVDEQLGRTLAFTGPLE